jgi:pimeloyl-ACP methyl ester carboxylesterase
MPIVLVHGNPETDAIWDELRAHLRGESIALSPPGFGAPVPAGFGATVEDYVAWLADELRAIDGPLDVIGHDWGGSHIVRVAATEPDLVRSWATDVAGLFDPEYVWHEFAQIWQTPDKGEAAVQQTVAAPLEARTARMAGLGMSQAAARRCAEAFTADMGRCILTLYRSAAQPKMAEWGTQLDGLRSRPGLVIVASEDHFAGGETLARRTADRVGARVEVLQGLGHWWMCQDPKRGAEVINRFVGSLRDDAP